MSCVILLSLTQGAWGQRPPSKWPYPFVPDTALGVSARTSTFAGQSVSREIEPRSDAWYSVDLEMFVAPLFLIFNGMRGRVLSEDDGDFYFYGLGFIPEVDVRMYLGDESSPVRSPSYHVRLFVDTGRVWRRDTLRHNLILRLTLGHHSNGQDGCRFSEEKGAYLPGTAGANGRSMCAPHRPTEIDPDLYNYVNGDFTKNYIRLDAGYMLHDLYPGAMRERWRLGGLLGAEVRPYAPTFLFSEVGSAGFQDAEQRDHYGLWSSFLQLEWSYNPPETTALWEIKSELGYAFGRPADVPGHWWHTAWSYYFDDLNGFGVQLRTRIGSDQYNFRFYESEYMAGLFAAWKLYDTTGIAKSDRQ